MATQIHYFDPGNTSYYNIGTEQAETFTMSPSYNYITSVNLKLRKVGSPGGNCRLQIQTVGGDGKPNGSLGEAFVAHSSISTSGYNWYTFTFAGNGIKVSPSTVYALVMYSTGDTSNIAMWWGSGSYWSGGTGYRVVSGSWTAQSQDYALDIYAQYIADTTAPTVDTTTAATNILKTTATSGGNILTDGGAAITERGVCYNTVTVPTTANSKVTSAGTTGSFSVSLTGLTAATTYHTRAYAINSVGTTYGVEADFATITDPTLHTDATGAVSLSTILGGGEITASGGATITERGLCYSSATNDPTTAHSKKINSLVTVSAWTDTITGLEPGTIYYIKAYVICSTGTFYGSVVSGTTSSAPNVTSPELYSTIDGNLNDGNIRFYTSADTENHFMIEQNGVLYISDRNYVHQVEKVVGTDVFSSFALDVPQPYKITTLGKSGTDLLIGTKITNAVNDSGIFVWNGWSLSYTANDNVKEVGVNAFIDGDNYTLASVGTNGNLYLYSSGRLELYKTIPGEYSPTKTCTVNPYATANFQGLPLFGLSNVTGNPALQGIYSYGSKKANFPFVLNLEFPISKRDGTNLLLAGIKIGAIVVVGNDIFCSWDDGGSSVGVDKLDYSNKLESAYLETTLIMPDRSILGKFNKYICCYKSLPTGSLFDVKYKKNHAVDWVSLGLVNDDIRKLMYKESMIEASTFRARVDFTVLGNASPELESLYVYLE
jgi:hypothetical protein